MRTFLLNSDKRIDEEAFRFLQSRDVAELFSCYWIYFNDHVKLLYDIGDARKLGDALEGESTETVCRYEKELLHLIDRIAKREDLSIANLLWDPEDIYLDEEDGLHLIYFPTTLPDSQQDIEINMKRIYAMLGELLQGREESEEPLRQIEYQMEHNFGNWELLADALLRKHPVIDEKIILKSINTADPASFEIGDEKFVVGSDPEQVNGVIEGSDLVSPMHAIIGWNGINFYVYDLDSENGTFVNDTRIAPRTEIPIGQGTVLKFADCTFTVE